jgi:hypothetical protein
LGAEKYSERDICTKFITPAIQQAGWDIHTQVREEVSFTKGCSFPKRNLKYFFITYTYIRTTSKDVVKDCLRPLADLGHHRDSHQVALLNTQSMMNSKIWFMFFRLVTVQTLRIIALIIGIHRRDSYKPK